MRCHAAEPGAVTSTDGFHTPDVTGVPGAPSAVRKDSCQGARARLYGLD